MGFSAPRFIRGKLKLFEIWKKLFVPLSAKTDINKIQKKFLVLYLLSLLFRNNATLFVFNIPYFSIPQYSEKLVYNALRRSDTLTENTHKYSLQFSVHEKSRGNE